MKAIASSRSTSTPAVGEVEHDRGVLAQHRGVGPVDVPLPRVEGRPDPALELVVPREVARREVGEDLGQRALVGVGTTARRARRRRGSSPGSAASPARAATAHSCSRATWLSTRSSTSEMPRPAERARERAQVVHRPEVGPHAPVVGHRVATVVVALARQQQRHQVQVRHPQLLEVGHPLGDAGQRARRSGRRRPRSPSIRGDCSQSGSSSRRCRAGAARRRGPRMPWPPASPARSRGRWPRRRRAGG